MTCRIMSGFINALFGNTFNVDKQQNLYVILIWGNRLYFSSIWNVTTGYSLTLLNLMLLKLCAQTCIVHNLVSQPI